MQRTPERDDQRRFSGNLRHYHRAGAAPQRSWEEWVDGKGAKSGNSSLWLKVGLIVFALLALAGIMVGLIIELS
jgi:hypothetical protein